MSFTQAGFYRWHEGGISSLALSAGLNATTERKTLALEQTHAIRLTYGIVRQNRLALRKAEDLIHLRSSITFLKESFLGPFQPAVTLDFRSQFAFGFKYDQDNALPPERVSAFLSPAILIQSAGTNYRAASWIKLQTGMAAKQTFVLDSSLRSRYKVPDTRIVRAELGLSALILIDFHPLPNVHVTHSVSLFAAFQQADRPDMVSETLITMTINKWLQVNAEYTAQLDRDVSRVIQMKEVVSLGLAFNLL